MWAVLSCRQISAFFIRACYSSNFNLLLLLNFIIDTESNMMSGTFEGFVEFLIGIITD